MPANSPESDSRPAFKRHWEHIYATKPADRVSWYQAHAEQSLRLIRDSGVSRSAAVIDVGGGASTLVDDLVDAGYSNVTVLDLSAAALGTARARLGTNSGGVDWIEGDISRVPLPHHGYDLWHDRAVFHFLVDANDRHDYAAQMVDAVKPDGHVIVATFAEDGPRQCSGLPVARYGPGELQAEFGASFDLLAHRREAHQTPFGTRQQFVYCCFRKLP